MDEVTKTGLCLPYIFSISSSFACSMLSHARVGVEHDYVANASIHNETSQTYGHLLGMC